MVIAIVDLKIDSRATISRTEHIWFEYSIQFRFYRQNQ